MVAEFVGESKHNTGISVDLNCINDIFLGTNEYNWLRSNAHDYDFIERYVKGVENEIGVIPESWHWRYVGKEFAKEVKESGKALERFIIENKILYK